MHFERFVNTHAHSALVRCVSFYWSLSDGHGKKKKTTLDERFRKKKQNKKTAVVVLLRRHTHCEESIRPADWLTRRRFVWQLGHVTAPTADWLHQVSFVGPEEHLCWQRTCVIRSAISNAVYIDHITAAQASSYRLFSTINLNFGAVILSATDKTLHHRIIAIILLRSQDPADLFCLYKRRSF